MGVNADASEFGKIVDTTHDIRTETYTAAIQHLIKEFEVQVGLSVGSMSYADSGVQTATEVVSNNSMTYQTRSSDLTMVEKAINELVQTIFDIAKLGELFPDQKPKFVIEHGTYKVDVHFDDGVFVNKDAQLEEDLKVAAAGFMPKKRFLIRNYGLSEREAEKWLAEIDDEVVGVDEQIPATYPKQVDDE